jgi:NTP pyrophosphatase (non-canonical NTP hydrolase)
VLWYLTNICNTIGMPLELVALQNVDKLKKRYPEGFDPKRSQDMEGYHEGPSS